MWTENHLGLPEELFEQILLLLDAPDLLSCSLVCSGWRNAVNWDPLWERLCRRKIPPERLQSDVSTVECYVDVEPSPNLTKLCPWRLQYAVDVQLKMRWKSEIGGDSFTLLEVPDFEWPDTTFEVANEVVLERSTGLYEGRLKGSFAVYDLSVDPNEIKCSSISPKARHDCSFREVSPALLKIVDDVLVVVQGTLLQVYIKEDNNDFSVKLVTLFDQEDSHSQRNSDLRNWNSRGIDDPESVLCDHNGKYFVGTYANRSRLGFWDSLHIWDLSKRTKVGVVSPADDRPGYLIFDFALRRNVVHVLMIETQRSNDAHGPGVVRSYDIDSGKYWHSGVQVDCLNYARDDFLFTDDLLITTYHSRQNISFHHLKTPNLSLPTIESDYSFDASRQTPTWAASDNLLAFAMQNPACRRQQHVKVYDMFGCRYVDEFKPNELSGRSAPTPIPWPFRYRGRSRSQVNKIRIFLEDLLLLCMDDHILIRDIKKRVSLRKFEHVVFLDMNPLCTKAVVYYDLTNRFGVLFYDHSIKRTPFRALS